MVRPTNTNAMYNPYRISGVSAGKFDINNSITVYVLHFILINFILKNFQPKKHGSSPCCRFVVIGYGKIVWRDCIEARIASLSDIPTDSHACLWL